MPTGLFSGFERPFAAWCFIRDKLYFVALNNDSKFFSPKEISCEFIERKVADMLIKYKEFYQIFVS